jgi:hypothetical protein
MKKLLFFFAIFVFALSSCTKSATPPNAATLHNTRLGIDVSTDMDKATIDKLLGDSTTDGIYYFYTDSGLSVSYNEGRALMLITSNSAWTYMDSIVVSKNVTDIGFKSEMTDGNMILFFDSNSAIISDKDKAKYFTVINYDGDIIKSIVITQLNGNK